MQEISGTQGEELDPNVVKWLCQLVDLLNNYGSALKTEYGTFSLPDVLPIYFDSEHQINLAIVQSEFSDSWVLSTWNAADEDEPVQDMPANVHSIFGDEEASS